MNRTIQFLRICLTVSFFVGVASVLAQSPTPKNHLDVMAFGAKVDGRTDDTAAIQKALDSTAKQGGVVHLPAGKYLVAGSLKIPVGVALVGSHKAPVYIEPLIGTVILATGGRDKEDAPALFEMGNSSTVQALTVFYPDQKPDDIHPYAWTFHLQGGDNTVENVTLINSYNGIKIGPETNVRHRIRSVSGCVLRRGLWLDTCSDIGYHFIATKNGAMNGQFVAFEGENPAEIVINPTCNGSVRLQNCDFWGPAVQNVVPHSRSFVSLSNCYFSSGRPKNPGKALVEADGGKLQVLGCSFGTPEPSILLGKGLKHAIVTGNNGVKGVTITNQIGERAIIANNEPSDEKR